MGRVKALSQRNVETRYVTGDLMSLSADESGAMLPSDKRSITKNTQTESHMPPHKHAKIHAYMLLPTHGDRNTFTQLVNKLTVIQQEERQTHKHALNTD